MSENQEQMIDRAKWVRPELATQESVSEVSLNGTVAGADGGLQENAS